MLCVVEGRGGDNARRQQACRRQRLSTRRCSKKKFMSKLRSDITKLHRHLLQAQPESASVLSKHRDRFPDGTQL